MSLRGNPQDLLLLVGFERRLWRTYFVELTDQIGGAFDFLSPLRAHLMIDAS